MILQLDIGNSRVKWRLQQKGETAASGAWAVAEARLYPDLDCAPEAVWVASVAGPAREQSLAEEARARWGLAPWFARASRSALGVVNSYREPEQLGVDRWLAMLAARRDCGGAFCVMDAGSALTIDFVDAAGAHLGGYILPGLESMGRALGESTQQLHFEAGLEGSLQPGRSTGAAVSAGLLVAQVGAATLALKHWPGRAGGGVNERALYFSGGDGANLREALGQGAIYRPTLVLDGLALLAAESAP